jgi:5-methylthioadenosine/S-adenosylhomocysteine deaminase
MEHVDTLICARWILPIEPAGEVLERHCVAIRQGRIVALLPIDQAAERYSADRRIERPSHVLLPGLVNAHTHGAMTLLRGAVEAAAYAEWTQQLQRLEQRWMDAEYVRDGAELAIADMLTSGTTCFGDLHPFPEATAHAAAAAGMRACIGLPLLDRPGLWAGSTDEYFVKGLQLHDEYRDDPLITTALAPYAHWAVSDETLKRVQRTADELELPVIMHVNEHRESALSAGERSFDRLHRLGLLSPLLMAVHVVAVQDAELDLAAREGVSIAHCPQSNLKLGCGVSPASAFIARQANLAIGTAGAAGNNDMSLLDELRTAALLARGLQPSATLPITAHQWLRAATLNGARALGLGDVIGSIAPDKWADLCCIDLNRAHTSPVHDVAAQIVYAASRDQVSDVWVAGRALLTDHQLTRLDLDDILRRAERWRQRIHGE